MLIPGDSGPILDADSWRLWTNSGGLVTLDIWHQPYGQQVRIVLSGSENVFNLGKLS